MTGPCTAVKPNASNEGGCHHSQLQDQDEGHAVGAGMMLGNNYTDAQFLTALRDCHSTSVRRLVIQLDSIAGFLRFDAIDPFDAADQLNDIGMSLLELAAAKRRKAAA